MNKIALHGCACERNVGHPFDKLLRVVVGIALLSLLVLAEGPARWLGVLGLVPILTVVTGWCPVYALFGFATREPDDKR